MQKVTTVEGMPPFLTPRRSSSFYVPPEGKLAAECFALPFQYATEVRYSRCRQLVVANGTFPLTASCMLTTSLPFLLFPCGQNLWVVAFDGSDLAKRALRLASFLMNPKMSLKGRQDNVLVVTCNMPGESAADHSALFADCVLELMRCGIWEKRVACKAIDLPDGWTVGDGLVYFANHVHGAGSTRLVLGAAGVTAQSTGAGHTEYRFARLGGIAKQCLAKVKVPVTIVKEPWVYREGPLGRVQRLGRNGEPGVTIVCCVDSSNLSELAFDMAVSLCREGDTLRAIHVSGHDRKGESELVASSYSAECQKVADAKGLASAEFVACDIHGSIADTVIQATADADVIVMGSVELSDVNKRHVLGSVCLSVAQHPTAHMMIVKSYAT
jgi:nucleotide-binding universal stress UspA family protein